nr:hypothetical protein [Candidatus Sigynarchaeum springense]
MADHREKNGTESRQHPPAVPTQEPGLEAKQGIDTALAPAGVRPRNATKVLHVVLVEPPPASGSSFEKLDKKQARALVLGCTACGTTIVIARPSDELVYVCSKCKHPFNVIRECRSCGNKLVLTQDEHHAAASSGKPCPVCMEPVLE